MVKNPPANAGDGRDTGSIPESGGSPGGGPGNPLRYSCLENPMDRGAWPAVLHKAIESGMTEGLSTHILPPSAERRLIRGKSTCSVGSVGVFSPISQMRKLSSRLIPQSHLTHVPGLGRWPW